MHNVWTTTGVSQEILRGWVLRSKAPDEKVGPQAPVKVANGIPKGPTETQPSFSRMAEACKGVSRPCASEAKMNRGRLDANPQQPVTDLATTATKLSKAGDAANTSRAPGSGRGGQSTVSGHRALPLPLRRLLWKSVFTLF